MRDEILERRKNDNVLIVGLLHYVPFYPLIYAWRRRSLVPILTGLLSGSFSLVLYVFLAFWSFDLDKTDRSSSQLEYSLAYTTLATIFVLPGVGTMFGVKFIKAAARKRLQKNHNIPS